MFWKVLTLSADEFEQSLRLFVFHTLSCVFCVPFSCVLIWFVSCPCLVSLLVNSCPANYLWLSCVVIVLSVQLVFVWSTPYSRCFCVSLALSCPALFELKTVILSLSTSPCSSFLPAVCTVSIFNDLFLWLFFNSLFLLLWLLFF